MVVEREPEGDYLGSVNRIRFSINTDYYKEIVEHSEFGYRFSTGGKLVMKVVSDSTSLLAFMQPAGETGSISQQ